MKAVTGIVIGFRTKTVIDHDELFKWHMCVCDKTHQYLFVCERKYPGDYQVTSSECDGLRFEVSYISMRYVSFRPKIPKDAKFGCRVSTDYLRGLFDHVLSSEVMSQIDKRKVLPGLARKLSE